MHGLTIGEIYFRTLSTSSENDFVAASHAGAYPYSYGPSTLDENLRTRTPSIVLLTRQAMLREVERSAARDLFKTKPATMAAASALIDYFGTFIG
ncbi:hypothetical protein GWE18_07570 [Bradyrhizobium sp. CSA112]|uniref:hypothetical protein n=1 Tax=Bradyrhizobium sp. CSA112 TaxID=2699170 RepID=UPI0023AE9E8B|nr:hypothetical protein [Bradyrhizobium sp. CSA112]MDE5452731.1 hypothetical protein [Bradyrhizobium sp. CSA112]